MLIYHKTKNEIVCTQVMLGAGASSVSHGKHVWEKHQKCVSALENNSKVYVTGATYSGAIYSGEYKNRKDFIRYIEEGRQCQN